MQDISIMHHHHQQQLCTNLFPYHHFFTLFLCKLLAIVRWAKDEVTMGPVLSRSTELRGKFSIQMVRMSTLCSPALFYLDHFTVHDQSISMESKENEAIMIQNKYDKYDHCDVKDVDDFITHPTSWTKQHQPTGGIVQPQNEETNGCIRIDLPSDVLWACEDYGLISAESIVFILTTTARPNTLLYYMNVKFLSGFKILGPTAILAFIGRYYCLRKRKEQQQDSLPLLLHPKLNNEEWLVSLGNDPKKWSVDVRNDMRSLLGNDISTIVTNLTKLI